MLQGIVAVLGNMLTLFWVSCGWGTTGLNLGLNHESSRGGAPTNTLTTLLDLAEIFLKLAVIVASL